MCPSLREQDQLYRARGDYLGCNTFISLKKKKISIIILLIRIIRILLDLIRGKSVRINISPPGQISLERCMSFDDVLFFSPVDFQASV